ncbi:methyltransferase [Pseudovibrio sp. WM33]|uniref:methyltransferase n=1 Tax=Pseudovibrio sp. WM33 TaxID=1735585 RepID=UPI0007AE5EDF|nr:methyltransferase [Pseudovibrio sp. WM33]KZL24640.1 Demethylspheroidene O-methyltransferase [Pseudovibrio sp. WM33]
MENALSTVSSTLLSFFNSQALIAAYDVEIFEAIGDGATSQEVFEHCNLPESTGHQLLVAMVAMGFVEYRGDIYTLKPDMAPCLLKNGTQYMGTLARHASKFLYPLWANSAQAIRTNSNQRKETFGDERKWFDILYSEPNDVADFHAFLSVLADPFVESFLKGFNFSPYKAFLDLGSGRAALPRAILAANPHLNVAVCDLPEAVDHMRQELMSSGHSDQVDVYIGDVISGDLPEITQDLVHMGWMLHDYSIKTQKCILANVFKALPSGATFIASETPLLDDETGPTFVALLSINMLISSDGGIESTTAQYLDRLCEAGFTNVRAVTLDGPRTLLIGEKP